MGVGQVSTKMLCAPFLTTSITYHRNFWGSNVVYESLLLWCLHRITSQDFLAWFHAGVTMKWGLTLQFWDWVGWFALLSVLSIRMTCMPNHALQEMLGPPPWEPSYEQVALGIVSHGSVDQIFQPEGSTISLQHIIEDSVARGLCLLQVMCCRSTFTSYTILGHLRCQ